MDISGRYEELIALLGSQLPAPVEQESADDGSIIFTGGAPPEVVVHLTDSSVRVSEFACTWETPEHFVVKPRLVGVVKWRRLSETVVVNAVSILIKGAREVRLARYRSCRSCGEKNPPERLFDGTCERCGELARDVVH